MFAVFQFDFFSFVPLFLTLGFKIFFHINSISIKSDCQKDIYARNDIEE